MSTEPNAPSDLLALSPCICGAVVDQDECPYPSGPKLRPDSTRQVFIVHCIDPNCGWQAIGWGAEGARKAWNARPSLSAQAVGVVTGEYRQLGQPPALTIACDQRLPDGTKLYTTPPQPADGGDRELPELPDSVVEVFVSGDHGPQTREAMEELYTPEQMHQYARAALAKFQPVGGENDGR